MKPLSNPVIIISGKNPLLDGGYASYAYSLAKTISSLSIKVKIFCVGEKTEIIDHKIAQIHIIKSLLKIPFLKDTQMAGLPIFSLQLAFSLRSHLPGGNSIVWGVGPWSLVGAILKLISRKKVILFSHYSTSFKHEFKGSFSALIIKDYGLKLKLQAIFIYLTIIQFYSLLEKFLLSMTDKIITHYSSTEKILINQYRIKANKFYRLPYSISHHGYHQKPSNSSIPSKNPLILLICRQDSRKGVNFLLRALSLLQQKRIKFQAVIAGRGKMLEPNRTLAKKLKLKNVFFPGFIADPSTFLKKASLFVFPSVEEGNSAFSLLEAMQARLPIVSTNVDGIPEDLSHNHSAILVPPKDPAALADAMEQLLQNPVKAKKLASKAYLSYQKKHGEVLAKDKLKAFLKSI